MAHGITETDSMFSVRSLPWHGLGTILDKQPKTLDEALRKSGLDWTIEQQTIVQTRHAIAFQQQKPRPDAAATAMVQEFSIEGFVANVRSDTGAVLGIVSDEYRTVDNKSSLQFLEALMGELRIETLGSLWGGRQIFATCELPDHIEVGGDLINPFVCMTTRHDGAGALKAYTTPVRQVCANTVRMALDEAQDTIAIRHVGDPNQQLHQARQILKLSISYYKQFAKAGNRLASQKMTERMLAKVMDELYPNDAALGGRAVKTSQRRREMVQDIVTGKTPTVGNAPGSKWSAYNALVEVHDHDGRTRSQEGSFVRKIEDPSGFKRRALNLVTAA